MALRPSGGHSHRVWNRPGDRLNCTGRSRRGQAGRCFPRGFRGPATVGVTAGGGVGGGARPVRARSPRSGLYGGFFSVRLLAMSGAVRGGVQQQAPVTPTRPVAAAVARTRPGVGLSWCGADSRALSGCLARGKGTVVGLSRRLLRGSGQQKRRQAGGSHGPSVSVMRRHVRASGPSVSRGGRTPLEGHGIALPTGRQPPNGVMTAGSALSFAREPASGGGRDALSAPVSGPVSP